MEAKRHHRPRAILDTAGAELVKLITDRESDLASGTFGVLVVLDRGLQRHVKIYEERTIDVAASTRPK